MTSIMKKLLWAVVIEVDLALRSVGRSVNRWLFPSHKGKAQDKFRFRAWLEVMQFEAKVVPASFTWKAGAAGNWDDATKWYNEDTEQMNDGYPDDDDDSASFDGNQSVKNVTLNSAVTINSLFVWEDYPGEIKLNEPLTVKDGVFRMDNGQIAPQDTDAHLILDSISFGIATFGTIGSTAHKSQLQVINGSELNFKLKDGNVHLGMDLIIGTAAGGAGSGAVYVGDLDANFQGRELVIKNDANITVYTNSLLSLEGRDGDGSITDFGAQSSGHVLVNGGTVERSGSGEVEVELPFLVTGGGKLFVKDSTLNIASNGTAATTNYSLYVSGGVVELGTLTGGTPTLWVPQEIVVEGGLFEVKSTRADVKANRVEFKGSTTTVRMTWQDDTNFTDLQFIMHGENAKVLMTGGAWHFDLKSHERGNDKVTVVDGNLEIDNAGDPNPGVDPILRVLMLGEEELAGEDYLIFSTVGGSIIGDFLAANKQFQNADFETLIFTDPLLPGMGYQLTTKAPPPPPPPPGG